MGENLSYVYGGHCRREHISEGLSASSKDIEWLSQNKSENNSRKTKKKKNQNTGKFLINQQILHEQMFLCPMYNSMKIS